MPVPEKILELVDRFESDIDKYKSLSYNEEDIKIDFINPLFEALGWDVGNKTNKPPDLREVKFEDSVEVQGRIKNPDFSFRLDRSRKFFVEAKKPAVNIEGGISPAFQLRSYAWSANLPVSIVTDFEEFAVYDCRTEPFKSDKPSKSRLIIIKYYEFEKRWDEIASLFSKEAVQNGSLDKYLESVPAKRGSKKVDDALLEDISGWREALAESLAKMNPDLDQKSLNHAVQMTIDRILFLRICEDRSIEDYGRLKTLLDGENVYRRLFKFFEEADKRYNSGLFHFHAEEKRSNFDTITHSINIEDKVLKDIIQELYFPDSPYVFSEIPAEILGRVYEQFLGKVIQLGEDHKVNVDYKPEVRKAGGVYYTPSYIVDYIVKNTVGKLLDGKSPKEASELRILDPACGSGSFLIGAYQHLLDWHLDWYKSNLVPLLNAGQKLTSKEVQGLLPSPMEKPGKNARARSKKIWERATVATLPIEQRAEEWHLRTAERKRILLNNIYGVDIDTQAVEVTKLSLLLKVLEGENKATIADLTMYSDERALPDLGNNIKCGNSLIGWDIQQDRPDLSQEELWRINPFDWQDGFKEVFARGGFDAVIGNPPYVRREILTEAKCYFQHHYKTYHGTADLYTYFIEKGITLLRPHGIFSFIVANKWLRTKYAIPLRNWLKLYDIEEIIDFKDLPIFQRVSTYPCIIRVSNRQPSANILVTKVNTLDFMSLDRYIKDNSNSINQELLGDSGWSLAKSSTYSLINKLMSQGIHLEDYAHGKIYDGIKTGLNKAFVIDRETRDQLISEDQRSKDLIKPFLAGRDIKRYQTSNIEHYLIYIPWHFPFHKNPKINKASEEAEIQFKKEYPSIYNYLSKFRQELISRDRSETGIKYEWYALQRPRPKFYEEFDKPKIIYPNICAKPEFTLDHKSLYINQKCYTIPLDDKYLLGILNSSVINYIFKSTLPLLRGGFFEPGHVYIKELPIPVCDNKNGEWNRLHDRIVALVENILKLHRQLASSMTEHEKTMLSRQIQATNDQINTLVYALYGLNEEEMKIVESQAP